MPATFWPRQCRSLGHLMRMSKGPPCMAKVVRLVRKRLQVLLFWVMLDGGANMLDSALDLVWQ